MTTMIRKLILAASAAAALGASAIALSTPSQARDWDRNGQVYDRGDDDRGFRDHRRRDDDEDVYRRPRHGQGWGWRRPHFAFGFGYNPGWGGQRPYYVRRHRWWDDQASEW
jgi:hypothetical protein